MIKKFTLTTQSLITLLVFISTNSVSVAQVNLPTNLIIAQFEPPPPPSRGAPGQRGTGASRGDCLRSQTPLTALVPSFDNSQKEQNVWGLTTRERPTFWFYIPFAKTCSTLELVLQDDAGISLYNMPIAIPAKPGIISVQLPTNAPALKLNQMYHWLLQAKVKAKDLDEELFVVDGWIQRINPSTKLLQQLKQTPINKQSQLYAKNGIWFDALTTLAELRLKNSQDKALAQDWKNLLKSVGLEKFAVEALVVANKVDFLRYVEKPTSNLSP